MSASEPLLGESLTYTVDSLRAYKEYKFEYILQQFALVHNHTKSHFFCVPKETSLGGLGKLSWNTPIVKIYCHSTKPNVFFFKVLRLDKWKQSLPDSELCVQRLGAQLHSLDLESKTH